MKPFTVQLSLGFVTYSSETGQFWKWVWSTEGQPQILRASIHCQFLIFRVYCNNDEVVREKKTEWILAAGKISESSLTHFDAAESFQVHSDTSSSAQVYRNSTPKKWICLSSSVVSTDCTGIPAVRSASQGRLSGLAHKFCVYLTQYISRADRCGSFFAEIQWFTVRVSESTRRQ